MLKHILCSTGTVFPRASVHDYFLLPTNKIVRTHIIQQSYTYFNSFIVFLIRKNGRKKIPNGKFWPKNFLKTQTRVCALPEKEITQSNLPRCSDNQIRRMRITSVEATLHDIFCYITAMYTVYIQLSSITEHTTLD